MAITKSERGDIIRTAGKGIGIFCVKKSWTKLHINLGNNTHIQLNGKVARRLYNVLKKHYS